MTTIQTGNGGPPDARAVAAPSREYNFDGIVGPTHNYGGLSAGNVASMNHGGLVSNPRAAALQGLAKMRLLHDLGIGQGVLPPHDRPALCALRNLGFFGSDEEVLVQAASSADWLIPHVSSASSMWTANAATVAPSEDTADGRVHLSPANLQAMLHRALEAPTTERILRAIFADEGRYVVHAPLPGVASFADEGAANHTRLFTSGHPAVHLFAWGRRAFASPDTGGPQRFPARQTLEASQAIARRHLLDPQQSVFPRQDPRGIDGGAFHTDVLAVGHGPVLLFHELAFLDTEHIVAELQRRLGSSFFPVVIGNDELPLADAIAAYPFNCQVVSRPQGGMTLLAPEESRENHAARRALERVQGALNPIDDVRYFDLRQSMQNGGGPACLRLRVVLNEPEATGLGARVLFSSDLEEELRVWVSTRYRDRLAPADLRDPELARESLQACDELTRILRLGNVYDFQR